MGDIFREIDEELKQERYEKLWRRYGKYAIGAAVAVVVAIAGYQIWQKQTRERREAEGARFAAAVSALAESKSKDAEAIFGSLASEAKSGYGALARLREAGIKAKAGDRAGAVGVYDALAADDGADKPLRDLATLLSALHQVGAPRADGAALRAKLEPLAAGKSPWRFSAQEIMALLALKDGKSADARKLYQSIADEPDAPRGIRTRSTQMLAVIGK